MRRIVTIAAAGALLLAAAAPAPARADGKDGAGRGEKVLEHERLVGVPRPYTGAANAIRGVPGGGLPWVLSRGEAKLHESGLLEVEVEGLVFDPADPVVVERGLANQNTVPSFKAIVSCRTVQDGAEGPVAAVVNVETALFPATTGLAADGGGDARIEELLALPRPCIAPIVFVTSPAGAWFAASSGP